MRSLITPAIAAAIGLALTSAAIPGASHAQVSIGVSVNFAPPPLPIYDQPPLPGPDYIWVPGYWAWDGDDYYWVPGTWVQAPEPGLLWTPAWWGWDDGVYVFHQGYWGPHIGFYGGVVYGFGYDGEGYEGGYWQRDHFFYNRSVNNVTNVNITNVYNKTVIINRTTNVSYNGPGGVTARPTPQQSAAEQERHFAPTPVQMQHRQMAQSDVSLRASANHGVPPVAATARPAAFKGPGVLAAARAGGNYTAPHPQAGGSRPAPEAHDAGVQAPRNPGEPRAPRPQAGEMGQGSQDFTPQARVHPNAMHQDNLDRQPPPPPQARARTGDYGGSRPASAFSGEARPAPGERMAPPDVHRGGEPGGPPHGAGEAHAPPPPHRAEPRPVAKPKPEEADHRPG